jgi:NAD(P)-dependent dehydrogenase (short-subunit alcohol dehydrogenase family)
MRPPGRLHYGAPSSVLSALPGLRILITGAARGIGAQTARRLHDRGAQVVLAGIEPELLAQVAAECGDSLAVECDVRDRAQVEAAVAASVEHLGGLDVVLANAGVASLMPLVGGDPAIFERTIEVNLLGVYYTLAAAAPHISHDRGYALSIASLAAAVHPPLLGAYSAAKAGVEAMSDALRIELAPTGARVGVAYFGELDTEMVSRGFGTRSGLALKVLHSGPFSGVSPVEVGVEALERGIANRSRRVIAPRSVALALHTRMLAQRFVDRAGRRGLEQAMAIAREQADPLTTQLPDR